jgi:hypothetical protein
VTRHFAFQLLAILTALGIGGGVVALVVSLPQRRKLAAHEDLILSLDGTFSDLGAAQRKGYLRRDMPRLHKVADAIRAKRSGGRS